jgi:hypothetical protein
MAEQSRLTVFAGALPVPRPLRRPQKQAPPAALTVASRLPRAGLPGLGYCSDHPLAVSCFFSTGCRHGVNLLNTS